MLYERVIANWVVAHFLFAYKTLKEISLSTLCGCIDTSRGKKAKKNPVVMVIELLVSSYTVRGQWLHVARPCNAETTTTALPVTTIVFIFF